jgi:signal peptidase II
VVVLLDQLTKWWAKETLVAGPCGVDGDGCIHLVGSLRLHLVFNTGAAFSTGGGLGPLFGLIAFCMALFLLNMARSRSDVVGPVILGVISGGALGNLVDRLARAEDGFLTGSVVDFIDAQWWPVFNVADSAVVVGVLLFAVLAFREAELEDEATGDQQPGAADDLADPEGSTGAEGSGGAGMEEADRDGGVGAGGAGPSVVTRTDDGGA